MVHVTSVNVACGYHASDPVTMRDSVRTAVATATAVVTALVRLVKAAERALCAVAVHHGSYSTFDETYGQLGAWVARNATDARGSIIERYLVDPCAAANPADLRTEIWWPVEAAATKEN